MKFILKKRFFPMATWIALKKSRKACPAKKSFTIHWLIVTLMIKIMTWYLRSGNFLTKYFERFLCCVLKIWCFVMGFCGWNFYGKESINSFELNPVHYNLFLAIVEMQR